MRAALEVARQQGVAGASRIQLRVVDAQTPDQAVAAVDRLIDREHVQVIIGTYGSGPTNATSSTGRLARSPTT